MSEPLQAVCTANAYKVKKNEPYMSESQREHFKQILDAWKMQIITDANQTLDDMKTTREVLADEVDIAAQEESFRLELRARERGRQMLKRIDRALDDIKNDEYGYCGDCGDEIGVARLNARPTANRCIECKTIAELKEKNLMSSE